MLNIERKRTDGRSTTRTGSGRGRRNGTVPHVLLRTLLCTLSCALILAACSAPGGTPTPPREDPLPPDTPPTGPVQNVGDQLRELGIDANAVESAPRKLDAAVEAEGEYSPLGMRARLSPKEVFAAGIATTCGDTEDEALRSLSVEVYDEDAAAVAPTVECYREESGNVALVGGPQPNSSLARPGSQSNRAIVAGQFDDDAFDEGLVLVADPPSSATSNWFLWRYATNAGAPSASTGDATFSLGKDDVIDLTAVVTDVTGDGKDDIVLAVLRPDEVQLVPFVQTQPGAFDGRAGVNNATRIDVSGMGSGRSLRLAVGNLDLDPESEVALLVRSLEEGTEASMPVGEVRYYLFDDLVGYAADDSVDFTLPKLDEGTLRYSDVELGRERDILTADVALGDFDGDGLDEVAFTGIGRFPRNGDPCQAYTFAISMRDDLAHGGGALADLTYDFTLPSSLCGENTGIVYEVFARAFDRDGDYTRELLANDEAYALRDGDLEPVGSYPQVYRGIDAGHFAEATTALSTADVNNDGRQDVLSYTTYDGALHIRGMGDLDRDVQLGAAEAFAYPVLEPYDNDLDGTSVQFVSGSHRVILTEPLVLAALASPPYATSYGQDPLDAVTSYGTSTTSGSSSETTVSVTSNATIGLEVGVDLGITSFTGSYAATFEEFKDKTQGTGYETTFTDTYETFGRDAVVFTSFPYDAYDYDVLASDQPAFVGQTMTLLLPRTPITRIVSTTYYNARVPDGSLRIDKDVFTHEAGDPTSYMSREQMQDLRSTILERSNGPRTFLQSQDKTVGQGNTSTTTSIDLSQDQYYINSVGYSRSYDVQTNLGGVLAGYSTGKGESVSVTTTAGEGTSISSSVPSVTSGDPDATYNYGMFTYMYRELGEGTEPGQLFQVVNFWAD